MSDQLKFPAAQILVFAKAPIENQVKTRLSKDIGVDNATMLYQLMLQQTIETVTASHLCKVRLYCTPDTRHPAFTALAKQYPVTLVEQQGNDLGERMYSGAKKELRTSNSIVILGTDCLQLTEALLGKVLAGLSSNSCDAIVTPAQDGGYVLFGLNRVHPKLFQGIDWGTGQVIDQTRRVLDQLEWKWRETPTLRDVDTIEDIKHVYENEHQYPLNTGVRELLFTLFN